MASDTTTAAAVPEEAEYESDPDEVKRSLVMRRREASDDEEEERESERQRDRRDHIHSDDESDGQGGAPAEYDDEEEEEEDEGELEEDDEEGDVYEDEEEEEGYEEEEGNDGEVKVKGMEGIDKERSTEGAVELSAGNNYNGNNDEKNDVVEEGMEEEKKVNEPFAVPTAGAFYMHDDRFRDNVGGRHRRTHGGRRLWESKDDRKWGHDKFEEMSLHERHYEKGRRTSRAQFQGLGKNQGPDQAYPRGNRSKAFNNNNNNQNQIPRGVRGRATRKYEPTWKNNNQAPPPQNKQLGKPHEKTSHISSGRAFTPMSNSQSNTAPTRKQVFASSLSSASPPFYPSGSSNKDVTLPQKRDVQSGSASRNLRNSGMDENFSMQHANTMHRGKKIADVNMDKLYIDDSSASSAVNKPLNSLQMPPSSQSRAQGRGVAVPQQIGLQSAAPNNKANRSSSTQLQAVQRSHSQSRIQTPMKAATQQLGQHSASGSQASSPPKAALAINSNDSGEVDSSSESSKLKSALLGKGKGSHGRGSFLYGGPQVMGAAGNMSVGHGDQNFPAFLPVMQFGGQHPRGIGVPAVGMAFPGYVGQPQLGVGNSEMTWLPVLAGAAGALGATYCPPYMAVDGAYNVRPAGQTSVMGSSSKENNTNKPTTEWKPSQRPESGSDEYAQQQNKPQPRRYSAMNLANDVLR